MMDLMIGSGMKKTKPPGKWREKSDPKMTQIDNCNLLELEKQET